MKKLAAIFAAAVFVITMGACSINRSDDQTTDKQAYMQEL